MCIFEDIYIYICILVTRTREEQLVSRTYQPRPGKRLCFKDTARAQVHSVATAAMNKATSSAHENVVGYEWL